MLLYRRLLRYTFRYKIRLLISLLCIGLAGLMEAGLAYLLKPILDQGFVEKDPQFIQRMPFLIVGVFLILAIVSVLGNIGMKWIAERVIYDLRRELFDKITRLPVATIESQAAGIFISKLTFDVMQLASISSFALLTLIKDSATIIGLVAIMFWSHWQLSLIALTCAPFIGFLLKKLSKRLRKISHALQDEMGQLNHVVEETLRGHREVRLYHAQNMLRHRFDHINQRLRRLNIKSAIAAEIASPITQVMLVISMAIIIWYASEQAMQNKLTVGGFVALLGAMAMLLNPIKRLARLNEQLQKGLAGTESIFAVLDLETEPDSERSTTQSIILRGDIVLKGLDFIYPQSDKAALHNINLHIQAGETIALVGASGSGKTTLANILARFYMPTAGDILCDGISIDALSLTDLRANIGFVGQHVMLFADSIAANIALGDPHPDLGRVEQAAKQAHAWEFIASLDGQLQHQVGENGVRLSGGQRQRLAIARALYKNAAILILDEATSALDTESEHLVRTALTTLQQGRTTIIIAHRLSTIENADRIVVLEQGMIREIGHHTELLALNGVYAKLHRLGQHDT